MNRIIKTLSVSAVVLTLAPGIANAQQCKSAASVASDIFEKVGTEAIALGCSAVKIALDKEGQFDEKDLLQCYKDATFWTNLSSSLTGWWNNKVAKNSWATLGPRHLETNKNLDGKLVGCFGVIQASVAQNPRTLRVILASAEIDAVIKQAIKKAAERSEEDAEEEGEDKPDK